MGKLAYLRNIVTLELHADKCTGCRMCMEVCPHGVFVLAGKKAKIDDRDACMECGACARNCAAGAISVRAGVGCASKFIHGQEHGTVARCFFRIWGYGV
ncbi:MAG: 4Fe-4S dicluster domain-containing protein [Kiritimatiellaeota bacterium]|nr:4Fe-4S dicluster domain-containing protein [Kiritimatiellota bacterium]